MRLFFALLLLSAPALAENFKPLDTVTVKSYYAQADGAFIEGAEGLRFDKGFNFFLFEDGWWRPKNFELYYSFKHTFNAGANKAEIFKAYSKYNIGKFSAKVGKDSAKLGPAQYGAILSANAEPFLMLKLQTEKPLRFAGLWDFTLINGWLDEHRTDASNPKLLVLRAAWQPLDWLEIAGNRATMYGGAGRPSYNLIEYPSMIIGKHENDSWTKWDNDAYAGYDVTFKYKNAKFYYCDTGTDVNPISRHLFAFPPTFGITLHSYQIGATLETEKDSYRLEFSNTNPLFYTHHYYNAEGYSYQGMSLGDPYGRNMQRVAFTHSRKFNDGLSAQYMLGYVQSPAFRHLGAAESALKEERYYAALSGAKEFKDYKVEPYLRLDRAHNYDKDPSPTQFDIVPDDKLLLTTGLSVSRRF